MTKPTLTTLSLQDKSAHLLGTAHISEQSVKEVQELIQTKEYDAIAIELCNSRYQAILNPEQMNNLDIFEVIKKGKLSLMLINLTLGGYQQRMAEEVEVALGAEMKAAIEEAQKHNLPIILIDREVKISLQRLLQKSSWWQNLQLFSGLILGLFNQQKVDKAEIEKLKQGDVLTQSIAELAQSHKAVYEVLIHERDQYMAAQIKYNLQNTDYKNILAVVGAGHVFGMQQQWEETKDPETIYTELEQVSQKKSLWRFFPWLIVGIILIGFIIGFTKSGEIGLQMVMDWVLINGTLSAIGAAIAFAHPLTILTAFIAAPLTSLNPTIGAGMVTAFVEAWIRKPKVADIAEIRKATATLTGWWQNKVARILLIFVFSSLGSAAGTYIAGFQIFSRLFE